jgi:adenylylsulfate kinase-like enzyme
MSFAGWLTGHSGSGKSAIARELLRLLHARGVELSVLSPAPISRSTPRSACTSASPMRYVLVRPRAVKIMRDAYSIARAACQISAAVSAKRNRRASRRPMTPSATRNSKFTALRHHARPTSTIGMRAILPHCTSVSVSNSSSKVP